MTQAQAELVLDSLDKLVYYQGATLYSLVVIIGTAIATGVCFLLYRVIKNFY